MSALPLSFLADVLESSGTSGSCGAVYSSISPPSSLFFPVHVFALKQSQMKTQLSAVTYTTSPCSKRYIMGYICVLLKEFLMNHKWVLCLSVRPSVCLYLNVSHIYTKQAAITHVMTLLLHECQDLDTCRVLIWRDLQDWSSICVCVIQQSLTLGHQHAIANISLRPARMCWQDIKDGWRDMKWGKET